VRTGHLIATIDRPLAHPFAPVNITLSLPCGAQNGRIRRVKHWEIIAEKLSASGLSWGCSSEIDATGRALYTADACRKDGKRFAAIADERLTSVS
jgi:hypothetical protein